LLAIVCVLSMASVVSGGLEGGGGEGGGGTGSSNSLESLHGYVYPPTIASGVSL